MIQPLVSQKEGLDALAQEKQYLTAIRSLLEDERFQRYVAGMKKRYDGTIPQMDALPAEEAVKISELKGVRRTYAHEIHIIESAKSRIIEIDERLAMINKTVKTKKDGIAGQSRIVSPKENK